MDYLFARDRMVRVRTGMTLRRMQAVALLDTFGDKLPPEPRRVIERFVATGKQGFFARRSNLLLGGYLYPDLPRNVAMLALA